MRRSDVQSITIEYVDETWELSGEDAQEWWNFVHGMTYDGPGDVPILYNVDWDIE